ncbi:MAG TPA: OmpA family protein [Ferrovibrio sp.]|uniref:OmpA family protein n=1 Tax=Ferrovibrio sp. TaxID=1917215 RepID=UPI002ED66762
MAGFGSASAGASVRPAAQARSAARRGATAAILVATMLGLGACSSMEWADPTGWFGSDEPAPVSTTSPPAGEAASADATQARFPNLSRVPPRPVEVTSTGERKQAVGALAADNANARHTDEELRARPADSNVPPPAPRQPVTPLPSSAAPAQQTPAPQAQAAPQAPVQQETLQPPAAASAAAPAQGEQQPPVTLQPPAPTAPVQSSANGAPRQGAAAVTDTFSQALAQSSATTLPPNLAQATLQPSSAGGTATAAAASGLPAPGSSQLLAVIRFGNGDTRLGSDDRTLLRKVAEYYKGLGGKGALRVVGYASSRTGNMDSSSHRQLNYSLSERRANAVTAELRRRGVAADKIRTTAGADSAPVYYEAMPIAEDYNRRVEIYLVN